MNGNDQTHNADTIYGKFQYSGADAKVDSMKSMASNIHIC